MFRFADEVGFWVTLALGVALFAAGFLPLLKIAVGDAPFIPDGLREALAGSS